MKLRLRVREAENESSAGQPYHAVDVKEGKGSVSLIGGSTCRVYVFRHTVSSALMPIQKPLTASRTETLLANDRQFSTVQPTPQSAHPSYDLAHVGRANEPSSSYSSHSVVSILDLKQPLYSYNVMEYEVVDCDDDDYSVEVEIVDVLPKAEFPHTFKSLSSRYSPQTETSDTTYHSISSILSRSTCSSSDSSAPSLPDPLYSAVTPQELQHHFLPTPFYPAPLVPLLCAADEDDILPLMCSALHQRHALGLDTPVVGLLLPRDSGVGARCEIMLGWMELSPLRGYILVRHKPIIMGWPLR